MTAKIERYEVLILCRNDKTGKRFDVGGVVTSKDFKKAVINNWLEIGVLKPAPRERLNDGRDS